MAIVWDSIVSPAALTAFVRDVPVDQNYILDQLFPNSVDNVLEVEFEEGVITTRAAKARAWDAPPMPGKRDQLTTRRVKLPAVSQMLSRGELDRLQLERLNQGGTSNAAVRNAIFDDATNNVNSVQARVELMRGDLLIDGKVTLPELGGIEADFLVPNTNFATAGTAWTTHATADILGDLRAWTKTYRAANGFNPGGIVCSEDTLYDMLNNQAIRDLYAGTAGRPGIITQDQLDATLRANRLPSIRFTYDAQVDVDGTATSILDPTKVQLVPPAGIPLGRTQWGMTATGLEFQNANVRVTNGPAGIVSIIDKDVRPPYRDAVYVDATVMPILTRPRALFVGTVA